MAISVKLAAGQRGPAGRAGLAAAAGKSGRRRPRCVWCAVCLQALLAQFCLPFLVRVATQKEAYMLTRSCGRGSEMQGTGGELRGEVGRAAAARLAAQPTNQSASLHELSCNHHDRV